MSYSWDKGPTVTLWIITATRGHRQPQREREREKENESEREDEASSLLHSLHLTPSALPLMSVLSV